VTRVTRVSRAPFLAHIWVVVPNRGTFVSAMYAGLFSVGGTYRARLSVGCRSLQRISRLSRVSRVIRVSKLIIVG
jgi:hypothetical protein